MDDIKEDIKLVEDFIKSGESKRAYCDFNDSKVFILNCAIKRVLEKYPELKPKIDEASERPQSLNGLYKEYQKLKRDIEYGKKLLEQIKGNGFYSTNTIDNLNAKIRRKNYLRKEILRRQQEIKEKNDRKRWEIRKN